MFKKWIKKIESNIIERKCKQDLSRMADLMLRKRIAERTFIKEDLISKMSLLNYQELAEIKAIITVPTSIGKTIKDLVRLAEQCQTEEERQEFLRMLRAEIIL